MTAENRDKKESDINYEELSQLIVREYALHKIGEEPIKRSPCPCCGDTETSLLQGGKCPQCKRRVCDECWTPSTAGPFYCVECAENIMHFMGSTKTKAKRWLEYGNLRFGINRQTALPSFKRAIKFDPNLADAHNSLACCLIISGCRERAIKHLLEALKINPNHYAAKQNLKAWQK